MRVFLRENNFHHALLDGVSEILIAFYLEKRKKLFEVCFKLLSLLLFEVNLVSLKTKHDKIAHRKGKERTRMM